MKTSTPIHVWRFRAFTLIELLVVIAIIALLASLTLPVLNKVKVRARVKVAQQDMSGLASAISQYEADYDRYPTTTDAEKAAVNANAQGNDFTYGVPGNTPPIQTAGHVIDNRELMFILLNETKRASTPTAPANVKNRNTKGIVYLNTRMSSGTMRGVSLVDFVYRDPWESPYIVSLDLSGDGKTVDAFYGGKKARGLSENSKNQWELNGPIMIWSLGPDGGADNGVSTEGLNKDNVLGWQ